MEITIREWLEFDRSDVKDALKNAKGEKVSIHIYQDFDVSASDLSLIDASDVLDFYNNLSTIEQEEFLNDLKEQLEDEKEPDPLKAENLADQAKLEYIQSIFDRFSLEELKRRLEPEKVVVPTDELPNCLWCGEELDFESLTEE